METDRTFLHVLRVLGYANLAALVFVLLGMKGGWGSWLVVAPPPLVAISGSVFYYLRWNRFFPKISKAEGRKFMRPYLLGLYLLVASAALVLSLSLYAKYRGA